MTARLDEEVKQLVQGIMERQAYRQVVAIHMLGHCLKYVTDFDAKLRGAGELDLSPRFLRDVRTL